MKRLTSHSSGELPNCAVSYPKALAALEDAVHALPSSGWEEARRRHAHEIATSLSDGAKASGWKEIDLALQALGSLLSLPVEEAIAVRSELRDKLLKLLSLPSETRSSESA